MHSLHARKAHPSLGGTKDAKDSNTMPPDTPTALDLTRRLIEREPVPAGAADPALAAAHGACERVYMELTRWVGSGGCDALFQRALRDARSHHAGLAAVRINPDGESHIEGIAEAMRTGDAGPTAAALEEMLRTLIELLSRFIGEDMVVNLLNGNTGDPLLRGGQSGEREG